MNFYRQIFRLEKSRLSKPMQPLLASFLHRLTDQNTKPGTLSNSVKMEINFIKNVYSCWTREQYGQSEVWVFLYKCHQLAHHRFRAAKCFSDFSARKKKVKKVCCFLQFSYFIVVDNCLEVTLGENRCRAPFVRLLFSCDDDTIPETWLSYQVGRNPSKVDNY